ncbi:MAG: esterase [Acidimicrobiales bacterium]|nr:esterase [Acidimicrobiales bacterium]
MGLLSNWFLALVVTNSVGITAALVLVERRRRRRRREGRLGPVRAGITRAASALLVVALVATCVAVEVNRRRVDYPNFAALLGTASPDLLKVALGKANPKGRQAAVAGHGVDIEASVAGPASGITRSAYVYLPPQYFDPATPRRRFPVLYLIHGSPGGPEDWINGGRVDRAMDHLIARHAVVPFIVVMPDANGSHHSDQECIDAPHGPQDETYLTTDVVRWADAHLRTLADRADRAVGGLSSGGYCGVNLAFRHQDEFSAVVSHSGTGFPDHDRSTGDLFGGRADLERVNTPVTYLPTLRIRSGMAVYLDSGARDRWSHSASRELAGILRRRGVPTTFHTVLGEAHSFTAYRHDVTLSLPWLSAWFSTHQAASLTDSVAAPTDDELPALPPVRVAVRPGGT